MYEKLHWRIRPEGLGGGVSYSRIDLYFGSLFLKTFKWGIHESQPGVAQDWIRDHPPENFVEEFKEILFMKDRLDILKEMFPNFQSFSFAERRGIEDGFFEITDSQVAGNQEDLIQEYEKGYDLGQRTREFFDQNP